MPAATERGKQIQDLTEQDLVNLRRTIYLTIMSSAGFEECAHKLAKMNIQEGYEMVRASVEYHASTSVGVAVWGLGGPSGVASLWWILARILARIFGVLFACSLVWIYL